MFVGRNLEIKQLKTLLAKNKSTLVAFYGRRRIGKSTLIEEFIGDQFYLKFEGLEKEKKPTQIKIFVQDLARQTKDPILAKALLDDWVDVFEYLTRYFSSRKQTIIFIDELPWLASGQSFLISLLKKYWDNHWKKQNVFLILCGSVSSFMVNKVIKSSALYGRIDWSFSLNQMIPSEALQMIKSKRSHYELFRYLLLFGGIPKYLESIDLNKSFEQNIDHLFFKSNSLLLSEYEKIFFSQFREHQKYEIIAKKLESKNLSLLDVSKLLKLKSSGGVKSYLDNLEKALFITSYTPFNKGLNSKEKIYKLTDEFLRFYFKFVEPHLKMIQKNEKQNLFNQLTTHKLNPWLGFCFENFCLKNALVIAEKLGFADKILNYGPYFKKNDDRFQIDLVYLRSDKTVTLFEIKYIEKIGAEIIPEVEKKSRLIQIPKGYTLEKALICQFKPDHSVYASNYFHHILTVEDFFN